MNYDVKPSLERDQANSQLCNAFDHLPSGRPLKLNEAKTSPRLLEVFSPRGRMSPGKLWSSSENLLGKVGRNLQASQGPSHARVTRPNRNMAQLGWVRRRAPVAFTSMWGLPRAELKEKPEEWRLSAPPEAVLVPAWQTVSTPQRSCWRAGLWRHAQAAWPGRSLWETRS